MLNIYNTVNETAKTSITNSLFKLQCLQQQATDNKSAYSMLYKELYSILADYQQTASLLCDNIVNNHMASLYTSWLNASAEARHNFLTDYSQLNKKPQTYNACLTVTAGLLVMGKLKKLYDDNPSTFNYGIRTDAINYVKCLKLFGGVVALSSKDIQLAVADFKTSIDTAFSDFIVFAGIDDSEQIDSIRDCFQFDKIAWSVFRDVIPTVLDYEKNYAVSGIGSDIVAETKLNLLAYLKNRNENMIEIDDTLVSIIDYDKTSFLDDTVYYFSTTKHNAIDNANFSDNYLKSYNKYACYYGNNEQQAGIKTTTAGKLIFSCIDSYLNRHKKELNNKADNISHILTASEKHAFIEICSKLGYTVTVEQNNGIQQAICTSTASKDIQAVQILYYTCCNFGISTISDKLGVDIGTVYKRLNSLKARLYKAYNKVSYAVSIVGNCTADKNNRLVCSNIHIIDRQADAKRQQASWLLLGYCRNNQTGVYGINTAEKLAQQQQASYSAVKQLFNSNHIQLLNKLVIQDKQQQAVIKSIARHNKKLVKIQLKKYKACIKNTCLVAEINQPASQLYFSNRQQQQASQQAMKQAVNNSQLKHFVYHGINALNSKPAVTKQQANQLLSPCQLLTASKPAIKQRFGKPAVSSFYVSKQPAISVIQPAMTASQQASYYGYCTDVYYQRIKARQHRKQAYKAIKQRFGKPAVSSLYASKKPALSVIQPAIPYTAVIDETAIKQLKNSLSARQQALNEQYQEQQQAFKLAYTEKYSKQA